MNWLELSASLLVLAAAFSYLNHRYIGLPTTIGLLLLSMGTSLAIVATGQVFPLVETEAARLVRAVELDRTLLDGLLGFLLFAGALHVDIDDLLEQKWVIALLSTVGLLLSTVVVGALAWSVARLIGVDVSLMHAMLFGALIAPTDPIAVLSILRSVGAPKSLSTAIAGESLFNDGIAVVVFLALLGAAGFGHGGAHAETTVASVAQLFAIETGGGLLLGVIAGLGAYGLIRSVDNYQVEILISLALVAGTYTLATRLHVSGPLAMVIAGLFIGNHGRRFAMSEKTREHLDTFWELIDEILNAVLFVLIGFEVLIVPMAPSYAVAAVAAIVIALIGRLLAVWIPLRALPGFRAITPGATRVLVWSGLRGGISVALALSLQPTLGAAAPETYRLILAMTYAVVAFSIVVQGLTVGALLRRLGLGSA